MKNKKLIKIFCLYAILMVISACSLSEQKKPKTNIKDINSANIEKVTKINPTVGTMASELKAMSLLKQSEKNSVNFTKDKFNKVPTLGQNAFMFVDRSIFELFELCENKIKIVWLDGKYYNLNSTTEVETAKKTKIKKTSKLYVLAKDDFVIENVICLFADSNKIQTCYSKKGKCSGTQICSTIVKGKQNEEVIWNSTCNNSSKTVFGKNNARNAKFYCK